MPRLHPAPPNAVAPCALARAQEAYWWLRDNTPADARVLSWWDYGYQIAGIANRTTLADGNTWNLEHIALIGKILVSPEKKAHKLARHLADYVLIWGGNQGDDLAKSPHMARISNSVYRNVCPDDPQCFSFGFHANRKPTKMMAESMLYRMHSHNKVEGVKVNPKLFREAYASKYGLVRIYEILNVDRESKAWLADPANRACDRPGSWYCPGRYPPVPGIEPPKTHANINYESNTVSTRGCGAPVGQPGRRAPTNKSHAATTHPPPSPRAGHHRPRPRVRGRRAARVREVRERCSPSIQWNTRVESATSRVPPHSAAMTCLHTASMSSAFIATKGRAMPRRSTMYLPLTAMRKEPRSGLRPSAFCSSTATDTPGLAALTAAATADARVLNALHTCARRGGGGRARAADGNV